MTMGKADESTERYAKGPSSDSIALNIGQGRHDAALIEMTEVIRRIDKRTEKMERRLEAQEQWTAGQKNLIAKIGYVVGLAFLTAVGGTIVWAWDASRGKA